MSYEPFLQLQYDLGRGLLRRDLLGFTFRVNVRSRDRINIGLNSGAMYEHERWRGTVLQFESATPGIAETFFIKSTSNISLRCKFTKGLNLFLLTYYQARFENFFRPRVISDIQLTYIINRNFSISGQYISTYDAAPILSQNQFIQTVNMNLNFIF